VVVATHNRRRRLELLLDALERQTIEHDRFEVIVIDDGSSDGTAAMLAARGGDSLRWQSRQPAAGPATARDEGWRMARGGLVAFTDDDCEPSPRWLEELVAAAADGVVVQGRTEPNPRERDRIGVFSRTIDVPRLGGYFPTCNIAYPRSLLESLGGFDRSFPAPGGEDTDLALRALAEGNEIRFAAGALVHHAVNQLGFAGKLRLALRWTGTMQVFARHPALRRDLRFGLFWRDSHGLLLLALLGALACRRFPPAAILAWPYLRNLRGRCNEVGAGPWAVAFLGLYDALETWATVRGGIRYRVPVV
jgi:GT2 family glycosyltransferase